MFKIAGHAQKWPTIAAKIITSAGSIHHVMWCFLAKIWPKNAKIYLSTWRPRTFKTSTLASRDVKISSQISGSNLQKVFTLGDGFWLPITKKHFAKIVGAFVILYQNYKRITLQRKFSKFLGLFPCKKGHASGSIIAKKVFWWNYFCSYYWNIFFVRNFAIITEMITKENVPKDLFCNISLEHNTCVLIL